MVCRPFRWVFGAATWYLFDATDLSFVIFVVVLEGSCALCEVVVIVKARLCA